MDEYGEMATDDDSDEEGDGGAIEQVYTPDYVIILDYTPDNMIIGLNYTA